MGNSILAAPPGQAQPEGAILSLTRSSRTGKWTTRYGSVTGHDPHALAPSEPSARVLIAELGPDEFLVMGFEASVEWRPAQSDYAGPAVSLSAQGGLMRLKLMRY